MSSQESASRDHGSGVRNAVFAQGHYAATLAQKIKRSLALGPKYYCWDLPRYFRDRRRLHLPLWDAAAFYNPMREVRRRIYHAFPLPPHYETALEQFARVGVQISHPRERLEALLGAWWTTRHLAGHVIECGSYRGATALMLALLGHLNQVPQKTLMLDTFSGMPSTSPFDLAREEGEFGLAADHVSLIRQQAAALGIAKRVVIHKGLFVESFQIMERENLRFAFAHIDANLYQSTKEACQFTLPRMVTDGMVVFDDYNGVCDLGARLAIDCCLAGTELRPRPLAGYSAFVRISKQ